MEAGGSKQNQVEANGSRCTDFFFFHNFITVNLSNSSHNKAKEKVSAATLYERAGYVFAIKSHDIVNKID